MSILLPKKIKNPILRTERKEIAAGGNACGGRSVKGLRSDTEKAEHGFGCRRGGARQQKEGEQRKAFVVGKKQGMRQSRLGKGAGTCFIAFAIGRKNAAPARSPADMV